MTNAAQNPRIHTETKRFGGCQAVWLGFDCEVIKVEPGWHGGGVVMRKVCGRSAGLARHAAGVRAVVHWCLGLVLAMACQWSAEIRAQEAPTDSDPCTVSAFRASDRPEAGGLPTDVTIGVRMVDLTDINDVDQTLTAEYLVRLRWTDPRLVALDGCEVPLTDV